MWKRWSSVSAIVLILAAGAAHAGEGDQHHDHGPVDLGKLGKVSFQVSCRGAQAEFSRAVAMMHSFWYAEAEKAFQRNLVILPKFGNKSSRKKAAGRGKI